MRDEETGSVWDHITGECFQGPLAGEWLDFWHVSLTNVAAELTSHPETILLKSDYRSLKSLVMKLVSKRLGYNRKGTILALRFRKSMHKAIDPRLPEGEQGLGLVDGTEQGKFYPVKMIPKGGEVIDEWLGHKVRINRNALDGVPFATWLETGEEPMQLLSRWYGFSFTYPDCEIYKG